MSGNRDLKHWSSRYHITLSTVQENVVPYSTHGKKYFVFLKMFEVFEYTSIYIKHRDKWEGKRAYVVTVQ